MKNGLQITFTSVENIKSKTLLVAYTLLILYAMIMVCHYGLEFTNKITFAISALMVVVALCFYNPIYGLFFLVVSLPYSGLLILQNGASTANKIFAILVSISFVLHYLKDKIRILFHTSYTLITYIILAFFNCMYFFLAKNPDDAMKFLKVNVSLVGLVFLVSYIPKDIQQMRFICAGSALGSSFLGLYIAFFGFGNLVGTQGTRLSAGTNENVLAHALGVCFLLSLLLYKNSRFLMKVIIAVGDFFILYAIALTGSRGTWVALLCCTTITPLFVSGLRIWQRILFPSLIVSLFLLLWAAFHFEVFGEVGSHFLMRLSELEFSSQASSGRMDFIWPFWIDKIFDNPFWGGGLGYSHYIGISTHNDLLGIVADLGLVGLFIFISLFASMICDVKKIVDPYAKILAVNMLIYLFICGLTHNTLYLKSFALTLGVITFFTICKQKESY